MLYTKSFTTLFVSLLALSPAALGRPCPQVPDTTSTPAPAPTTTPEETGSAVTPAQILIAAPGSATCDATASCRTAEQAAPFINQAFDKYEFATPGEQAAILSLMAFESGDFKFDVNLFPGRPGQGTRNMMTFPFILEYALEFDAEGVAAIDPTLSNTSTPDEINAVPADTMNAIRALVLSDELSFGSAAWFLREKCTADIAEGLQAGTEEAYSRYMTVCIGTTDDPARFEGYTRALGAFDL